MTANPADDRLYPPRPLLAVSVAVFRAERVLLAQRAAEPFAGLFTLPGGLVEPGERLAEAVLRELHEEVSVQAALTGFNRHLELIQRDQSGRVCRHYVIASFVGQWIAGEGNPKAEVQAVVWASRDEIETLPTTPSLTDVLCGAWALADAAPR